MILTDSGPQYCLSLSLSLTHTHSLSLKVELCEEKENEK